MTDAEKLKRAYDFIAANLEHMEDMSKDSSFSRMMYESDIEEAKAILAALDATAEPSSLCTHEYRITSESAACSLCGADYLEPEKPEGATVPVMPPLDEQDVWRSLGYDDEREPAVRAILDGARYAYEVGFNRGVEALAKGED